MSRITSTSTPRFITIEGGEGAGKSTATRTILSLLAAAGIPNVTSREPGGTAFGERLRELLLDAKQSCCPEAELLAMFAARAQHLNEVILPALSNGQWIVCDRFIDSSYAYQCGGRGVAAGVIAALEGAFVHRMPDLTILLDVDPLVGQERVALRHRAADRIEAEHEAFHARVRQAFLARARAEPGRIRVVDASASPATVAAEVWRHVEKLVRSDASLPHLAMP